MMYNSDAKQDQFVSRLFDNKNDGFYLDIGSCDSICSNNTFYFDQIGWKGICIEIDSKYNYSYNSRKNCLFINDDAKKIDYSLHFDEYNVPEIIDYLSLDVDTLSLDVLQVLPFEKFKFNVITIEHDSYLYGDKYKKLQRDILSSYGYELICSDVLVEQPGFYNTNCPFEDWWVLKSSFNESLLNQIRSDRELPSTILSKF